MDPDVIYWVIVSPFNPADMQFNSRYHITSVIRWSFFPFQNSPKNLDSYKMDLDLKECLGRVKPVL